MTGRSTGRSRKGSPPHKRATSSGNGTDGRVPIAQVLSALDTYEGLLQGLGLQADRAAIRRQTTCGLTYRGPMKTFFSRSHADKHPHHTAPAKILTSLTDLSSDLAATIASQLNGAINRNGKSVTPESVQNALPKLQAKDVESAAQAVLSSQHATLVRRQEIPIDQFRTLLNDYAQGQTLARKDLIQHIQEEFKKRGIRMSFDTIEERFRTTTTVKTMPACVVDIIRGLDGRFRTGLIGIDEMCGDNDPKEWLEVRRLRYFFKSASAMHQALAAATGLRYDSIHKALGSRVPAKRIQKDIKDCFDHWEKLSESGVSLGVSEDYRGVPVAQVTATFEELRRRFGAHGKLKERLAAALGVTPSWVQRYMTSSPRVKYMPMRQYLELQDLAKAASIPTIRSYIQDDSTRAIADSLCQRANMALELAKAEDDPDKALGRYRHIRRQLIETLKQRRTAPELAAVSSDD